MCEFFFFNFSKQSQTLTRLQPYNIEKQASREAKIYKSVIVDKKKNNTSAVITLYYKGKISDKYVGLNITVKIKKKKKKKKKKKTTKEGINIK